MTTCLFCGRLSDELDRHCRYRLPEPVLQLPVLNPDETPYCVSSTDLELASLLTTEWDHDRVLAWLPE